jgi:hypothetical protein
MSQKNSKEALFNEIKGSLFEFLVARKLASLNQEELVFLNSIDKNYLKVLGQQDQLVRQFYPEMLSFLNSSAEVTVKELINYLKEIPRAPILKGKFSQSAMAYDFTEADLIIETTYGPRPLSLKLNKMNSFVNTKSGGIKSFYLTYFSFLSSLHQDEFNKFVDIEFERMSVELHDLNDWDYPGNFSHWIQKGKSELPGELNEVERDCLKKYYARIAQKMHQILSLAQSQDHEAFARSLAPLLGFSHPELLQVICFHLFKTQGDSKIEIISFDDIQSQLINSKIMDFNDTASVDIVMGPIELQIRVKPMNKFTTTAIKVNCAVKSKPF